MFGLIGGVTWSVVEVTSTSAIGSSVHFVACKRDWYHFIENRRIRMETLEMEDGIEESIFHFASGLISQDVALEFSPPLLSSSGFPRFRKN
tara:strand:- start:288 stop:560 length:273 start_codon:yes stop_codon:yes gene_type:complete